MPSGWTLRYWPITSSTNDEAKEAARAGCSGRTIFLANEQTAGRGRRGRIWTAPRGTCLLFSLLLRERLAALDLTVLCSVALAEAIRAETGLEAAIKWPNDVMIRSRKVCGVLTEVVQGGSDPAAIVGVGLNVNLDLPAKDIPPAATSLSAELGRPVSRQLILGAVLDRVQGYLAPGSGTEGTIHDRWQQLLWRNHQGIRLADGSSVIEGIVEGVSPSGGLRLRTTTGEIRELQTGELLID